MTQPKDSVHLDRVARCSPPEKEQLGALAGEVVLLVAGHP